MRVVTTWRTAWRGILLRTIGAARAKVGVTLMNLAYNLSRDAHTYQGIWL